MSQKQQLGASSFLSRLMVSLVVGLLYVAACACPAVKVENPGPPIIVNLLVSLGAKLDVQGPEDAELLGVETLLEGWHRPLIIPWSANILLLIGWILLLCKKNTAALSFGAGAVLAGLSTWAFSDVWKQLLLGYYLWQASLVTFALGALAIRYQVVATRTATRRLDPQAEQAAAADRGPMAPSTNITAQRGRGG